MVDLADEWDAVRVAASHRAKDSEGRRHRVAVSLDCELDDFFAVEVDGIGRKRRSSGVLYPLVDWQDRQVAGARQAAMLEQGLQTAKYPRRPVAVLPYPVDEIRTGQMELRGGHRLALVPQEVGGVASQDLFQLCRQPFCNCSHQFLLHIWLVRFALPRRFATPLPSLYSAAS